ncbi:MAG TPA: FAD-dependent monooxygenase [Gammaproteobacteria bacterium]|nr:FAD-dependent monooxygenase [Gammaproteobacteria bacterium]
MSATQVLIVGGSLNGLTAALLLARHGVRCTVVERHPDTTVQCKLRGIRVSCRSVAWTCTASSVPAPRCSCH